MKGEVELLASYQIQIYFIKFESLNTVINDT